MKFHSRFGRAKGFTLTEVLIAAGMAGVVIAGAYFIAHTGTIVAVRSLSINATGTAARLSLDRVEHIVQSAYEAPTPINSNGTTATGDGPFAGIRFYRYVGGPYVVTIPQNGLSGMATSIDITRDNRAQVVPPIPEKNDALVINTTILMSGEANQVRALVSSASVSKTTGDKVTYTVTLSKALTGLASVLPNDGTTVTATLIRPTALVVTPGARGRELRLLESFAAGTSINVNTNPTVLSDQIAVPSGSEEATLALPFSIRNIDDRPFVEIALRMRDNRYDRYLASGDGVASSASFMGVDSRIPFKCDPNR